MVSEVAAGSAAAGFSVGVAAAGTAGFDSGFAAGAGEFSGKWATLPSRLQAPRSVTERARLAKIVRDMV
jgi:hypothetical protein